MDFIDFIQPTSVLQRSDNIINTEHLFLNVSLHNVLAPKSYCAVKGKGYLVLDFGKEYFGGIRISFAIIRLRRINPSFASASANP